MRRGKLLVLTIIFEIFLAATAHSSPDFTKAETHELLEFARSCLLARLDGAAQPEPPAFARTNQRACFVTFFQGKRVLACFGGFTPRRSILSEEIADNVTLALKNDPRSRKIKREAVKNLGVQITFPGQPERVANYQSIDPAREGMFVENSNNGVAFVPGEARTAAWAFREALRRLGEHDPAAVQVYSFRATSLSTRSTE